MTVLTLPNRIQIHKHFLSDLYINKKQSSSQIAKKLNCSENKINYWLAKYEIKKRTISDAIYDLKNPLGDPFAIKQPKTLRQGVLFGLGLGIYWGEGLKRGKGGVRLTNTDAQMVRKFIDFLEKFCGIDRSKLRFSLQIFKDIDGEKALDYWRRELGIKKQQFYKTIVSKIRGEGTYKYKSDYGVIIVYFNNVKLKKIILEMIEKI
jgi:hypothetical protein